HLARDARDQKPRRNREQPDPAAQLGLWPRQMQADGDRGGGKRQRDSEFQVEERIMHRGHHVRPHAELGEKYQQRHRKSRQQCQRQHEADGARARCAVGGKGANELIGIHPHGSLCLAARLASPRCNATRTAPSLIASLAAVSLIDALSTAIDCSTSRCRAGRELSWVATSVGEAVSAAGVAGRVSAKSSILTKTRRPRRRSVSISLLRAIANSQGANGALTPQVCRFRCTASKISCTISSD